MVAFVQKIDQNVELKFPEVTVADLNVTSFPAIIK